MSSFPRLLSLFLCLLLPGIVGLPALAIATETVTPTEIPTEEPTEEPTDTPTRTPSPTMTQTPTPTMTPTLTCTPTITLSVTPTLTATLTPFEIGREKTIAYPSPATGDTVWFYYYADAPAEAEIAIYNVLGERCDVLTARHDQTGYQRTAWNIRGVAPGVYIFRVRLKTAAETKDFGTSKLIIAK